VDLFKKYILKPGEDVPKPDSLRDSSIVSPGEDVPKPDKLRDFLIIACPILAAMSVMLLGLVFGKR